MATKVNPLLSTILKLLFAAALISWLIQSDRFNLRELQSLLNPKTIACGLFLIGLNLWMCSERWRQILQSQRLHISSLQTLKFTFIGTFFNFFVPGGVGGDVVKGYYIARNNPQDRLKAAVTVAMDRLLGLFAMILMALLAMSLEWEKTHSSAQLQTLFFILLGITFAFCFFWASIFSRRISSRKWVEKLLSLLPFSEKFVALYTSFTHYRSVKKVFALSLLWSLAAQSIAIYFFIFIGSSVDRLSIPISTYFYVVPIGFIATALPLSPGGIGVGQTAFYFLFTLAAGAPSSIGSTAITAMQISQLFYGLWGAYYYIISGGSKASSSHSKERLHHI